MATLIVPYVLAYLIKDNKVLLSLRSSSTSFGAHQYALIGGKIDKNESPTEALMREVQEEVGCILDTITVDQVLYFKGHKDTCVAFTFKVDAWQGEPNNKEPEKHEHIKWFNLDDLPENILPRHRYIITCIREGVSYAEWGFEGLKPKD